MKMYEIADKTSEAEYALYGYETGGLSMSGRAAGLLKKQVVAMKAYHDIIAARISHQVEGAAYGTEF